MNALEPTTVVATFTDREVAERAATEVTRLGVPPADVHLHEKGVKPRGADGVIIDEYASGGFFSNFARLLDGLMNTPRKSPTYEELVQFEGMAVSVQVTSGEMVEQVEQRLRAAGAIDVKSGAGLGLS